MGRPLRIIQTIFPYHITTRTNNKEFRFNKKKIIKLFVSVLNQAVKKYNVTLLHVVIMSNHYHIILKINEKNLHRFFQFVNSRIAIGHNRLTGRSGHLWGDRYKSTIISTDEHYIQCVKYIYNNPIRAGLVSHPKDFENSTFHFHAFGKKIDIQVVEDQFIIVWKPVGPVSYHDFFQSLFSSTDNYSTSSIKEGLRKQAYGPPEFVEMVLKSR